MASSVRPGRRATGSALGALWQRTAFVEEQLSYIEMCHQLGCSDGEASAGIEHVIANAQTLLGSCRSDRSKGRVNRLIAKATRARLAIADTR